MVNNYILLVFEGVRTEKRIFKRIEKYYLNDAESILISIYGTTIYDLYQKLQDDEYLDLFSLLKENPINKDTLSSISSDRVSQIYLFFDYDGHHPTASNDDLLDMLGLFDNETEKGMLYISYPMVEALKHIKDTVRFKDTTTESNKTYKKLVSDSCNRRYLDYRKYNEIIWNELLYQHCKKLNYIVNGDFKLPKQYISQIEVFEKQKEKYLDPINHVAVLSAFPIFLFDYYGHTIFSVCEMSEG